MSDNVENPSVSPAPGFEPPALPPQVTAAPTSSFRRLTPEELAAENGVPGPATPTPPAAAPSSQQAPVTPPAYVPPAQPPQPAPPAEDPIAAAVRQQEAAKEMKQRYDDAVTKQTQTVLEAIKQDYPDGDPKLLQAMARQMAVTQIQSSIAAVQAAQQQLPAVIDPVIQQAQASQQAHERFASAFPAFANPELRGAIDAVAANVLQAAQAAGRPIQDEASLFQATAAMLGMLMGTPVVPNGAARPPAPGTPPVAPTQQYVPPAMPAARPAQAPPPGYTWVLAPASQHGVPTGMPPHHVAQGLPVAGAEPVNQPVDDLTAFMALQRRFNQ